MWRDTMRRLGLGPDPGRVRPASWDRVADQTPVARPGRGVEPWPPPVRERPEPPPGPEEHSGVRVVRPERAPTPITPESIDVDLEEEDDDASPPIEAVSDPTRTRVLGVNIVDGAAYLAVIDPPQQALPELATELIPAGDLDGGEQLADFAARVARTLQEMNVAAVAIARPVRYTNWTYPNAFERASLETCFMLEAQRRSLRFESVGQHHAANVVGLPRDSLSDALPGRLGIKKMGAWTHRWPAVLVALAVAVETRP